MKSFRLFRFLDFVPAWSFDRVPVSELRVVEALAWPLAALLSRDVVSRDALLCSVVTQYIVLLHVHRVSVCYRLFCLIWSDTPDSIVET